LFSLPRHPPPHSVRATAPRRQRPLRVAAPPTPWAPPQLRHGPANPLAAVPAPSPTLHPVAAATHAVEAANTPSQLPPPCRHHPQRVAAARRPSPTAPHRYRQPRTASAANTPLPRLRLAASASAASRPPPPRLRRPCPGNALLTRAKHKNTTATIPDTARESRGCQ